MLKDKRYGCSCPSLSTTPWRYMGEWRRSSTHFALQYLKVTHWRIKVLDLVGSFCLNSYPVLYYLGVSDLKKKYKNLLRFYARKRAQIGQYDWCMDRLFIFLFLLICWLCVFVNFIYLLICLCIFILIYSFLYIFIFYIYVHIYLLIIN
jgi:hypothetical protein